MSPIRILVVTAGLLIVTVPSAMADGFRYSGGPKFSQFYDQSNPGRSEAGQAGRSLLDARAQLIEPRHAAPKGGIGARGP
ncbi:MAG: hypothetical protein ACREEK_31740 [Bradyrhizobium sp.]